MAKKYTFLAVLICLPLWLQAQDRAYFSHTEFGAGFGRTRSYDSAVPRINFTAETFHGVRVQPNHAVGISLGYDTYPDLQLIPLSFGWRGFRDKGGRTDLFAAANVGYGSSILNKREFTPFVEEWHEGGAMVGGALGIRKKSRKNTHAFTWSIGYKRQYAYFYRGYTSRFNMGRSSFRIAPGMESILEEAMIFNSLSLRWGLQF